MGYNSPDDYVQQYAMIAMAEEIQKLKDIIEGLKDRNQEEETYAEDELFDSEGRYLW